MKNKTKYRVDIKETREPYRPHSYHISEQLAHDKVLEIMASSKKWASIRIVGDPQNKAENLKAIYFVLSDRATLKPPRPVIKIWNYEVHK